MNVTETPENWVVLKISGPEETYFKVFAGWRGGYTSGDRWKMNSGIVSIEEDEDYYYFEGQSGSWYKCNKNSYGLKEDMYRFSSYVQGTLESIIQYCSMHIEILDEETDFTDILITM